mgnify:CR=1 FL=1
MKYLPLFLIVAAWSHCRAEETSTLWGNSGELWTPESRLPDFSFAGYRRGEEPYRVPKERISVKDFGATGDGKTDDIEAFRKAIAEGEGKVIHIPAGRYVLSAGLDIQGGQRVLRGDGTEKTVLLFTRGLEEISPNPSQTSDGKPTSEWSWGGGLIHVQGSSLTSGEAIRIAAPATRGESKLTLEKEAFQVGDEVILTLRDGSEQSLLKHLYREQTGDISGLKTFSTQQVFRVKSVSGTELTLDRALRFDVRREWSPNLSKFSPNLTDVGIEELAFEFPATPYAGHWQEVGFNPIQFGSATSHCWAKNLRFRNADNGIFVKGLFTTLEGIHFDADRSRLSTEGMAGHHGLTLTGSDCLATGFAFEVSFFHDLTVSRGSIGNVFSKGRAPNMNMDHHRYAPYENLFTDLDLGEGTRAFNSGGGITCGQHTAAGETFWNLRSNAYQDWPAKFGPDQINLVALRMRGGNIREPAARWIESIRPGGIVPPDLHLAMREHRLGTAGSAPSVNPTVATTQRWKSVDGRETEATFGGLQGDQVTLIVRGKPFTLSLDHLSPESQELARQMQIQSGSTLK